MARPNTSSLMSSACTCKASATECLVTPSARSAAEHFLQHLRRLARPAIWLRLAVAALVTARYRACGNASRQAAPACEAGRSSPRARLPRSSSFRRINCSIVANRGACARTLRGWHQTMRRRRHSRLARPAGIGSRVAVKPPNAELMRGIKAPCSADFIVFRKTMACPLCASTARNASTPPRHQRRASRLARLSASRRWTRFLDRELAKYAMRDARLRRHSRGLRQRPRSGRSGSGNVNVRFNPGIQQQGDCAAAKRLVALAGRHLRHRSKARCVECRLAEIVAEKRTVLGI